MLLATRMHKICCPENGEVSPPLLKETVTRTTAQYVATMPTVILPGPLDPSAEATRVTGVEGEASNLERLALMRLLRMIFNTRSNSV